VRPSRDRNQIIALGKNEMIITALSEKMTSVNVRLFRNRYTRSAAVIHETKIRKMGYRGVGHLSGHNYRGHQDFFPVHHGYALPDHTAGRALIIALRIAMMMVRNKLQSNIFRSPPLRFYLSVLHISTIGFR